MAEQHGAHQTSEAYVVSLCEDFCKSPTAPVGYMILQKLDMSTLVCGTVNGCGTPILNLSSRITHVTGNEAGVGGGVVSGVNVGMCKPIENYAAKVRAEGKSILRHDTILEMNCAGPGGVGNIRGKIVYCDQQSDGQSTAAPIDKSKLKKLDEIKVKSKDGKEMTIPVYELPSATGGGFYSPSDGAIFLGPTADEATLANETQHAADDALDGSLNGKLHKVNEAGNLEELSYLEAEARSDQASIDVIRKKISEGCDSLVSDLGCFFGLRNTKKIIAGNMDLRLYESRKRDLEKADQLIKEGKLEEARELGQNSEKAGGYIDKAIRIETECPNSVDGVTQLYIGGKCG